jgi:ABC-2 type transport system permease protein
MTGIWPFKTPGRAAHPERLHPLGELTRVRMKEFLREPEAVFWVFFFPIVMTCALGVAFRSTGAEAIPVAVVAGPESAAFTDTLQQAGGFVVRQVAARDIDRALRDGLVQVVIAPGHPPTYRYDPARAESRVARMAVDVALQRAAGRRDAFVPREDVARAVGSRYIDWLVPGLLGMNIMGTGMWSTSFAIVTARTRKLLKRLAATPMPRGYYLASLVISRLVYLVGEAALLLVFAWAVFDVAVHGTVVALSLVCLVGAFSFSGLALLASCRARTVEAVSGLLNLIMVPMWVGSGVFFSATNFPDALQPFVQALPLTALNDALRAVMNDGQPVVAVLGELAVLAVWGGLSFLAALRLFRWT